MVKTILVVDDERDVRESIKSVLEKNGYDVITAIDGDDCMKKVSKKKRIDLILLDIMMPGMPVGKLVSKLKAYKVAYLTVVRVSEAEKGELLKKRNIVDFIQKPFDIDALVKSVRRVVGD